MKRYPTPLRKRGDDLEKRNADLLALAKRLAEAGSHSFLCNMSESPCSCGWGDALAEFDKLVGKP